MNTVNISENLQYLMKIHGGLSVSELARQTNIPQPTLHHILSGTTKRPRREALEAIAKFFSLTVTQLLDPSPCVSLIPEALKETLQITTLPVIHWDAILSFTAGERLHAHEKHIIIDKITGKNSFAVIMPDDSKEPLIPAHALLIFDTSAAARDRSFVLVQLHEDNRIVFNRLFMDGNDRFIKQQSPSGETTLIALKRHDNILASLIEVRMQF